MRFMLERGVRVFRRRLDGSRRKLLDFAILEDLAEEGYTDYLIIATELFPRSIYSEQRAAAASSSPGRPTGRAASPTTT